MDASDFSDAGLPAKKRCSGPHQAQCCRHSTEAVGVRIQSRAGGVLSVLRTSCRRRLRCLYNRVIAGADCHGSHWNEPRGQLGHPTALTHDFTQCLRMQSHPSHHAIYQLPICHATPDNLDASRAIGLTPRISHFIALSFLIFSTRIWKHCKIAKCAYSVRGRPRIFQNGKIKGGYP